MDYWNDELRAKAHELRLALEKFDWGGVDDDLAEILYRHFDLTLHTLTLIERGISLDSIDHLD